jgi:hypothetical protein
LHPAPSLTVSKDKSLMILEIIRRLWEWKFLTGGPLNYAK